MYFALYNTRPRKESEDDFYFFIVLEDLMQTMIGVNEWISNSELNKLQ